MRADEVFRDMYDADYWHDLAETLQERINKLEAENDLLKSELDKMCERYKDLLERAFPSEDGWEDCDEEDYYGQD